MRRPITGRLARQGFCILLLLPLGLRGQVPTAAQQIAAAILPLPKGLRAEAAVVLLGRDGTPEALRPGTNGMICLADTPGDTLFDVRCYHRSFMPLIYRRRQLARQGMADAAAVAQLDREVQTGALLSRPWQPTAGYRMLGPISGFDFQAGTADDRIDRWQSLHLPYATATQLGVTETEDGIQPFMMASGTYWAHLMIMERPLRY